MNSMPADVDVNAQWHRRDTLGAIRRTVMINNSAYCRALETGLVLCVCLPCYSIRAHTFIYVCALHVDEGMWGCAFVKGSLFIYVYR